MKVTDVVYAYDRDGESKLERETKDFQHVVGIELGGGYDWQNLQAWYSPSRRKFYWLDGSGCSCNSLGDGINAIEDFTVGNREELSAAVRRKYDDSYSSNTGMASALLGDLAAVKTFRPAPAPSSLETP